MSKFNRLHPTHASAICSRPQAEALAAYDHYVVHVQGLPALLLTGQWTPLESHSGPFVLTVVFQHTGGHPQAPPPVQSVVDELTFQVRGQPR